MSVRTETALETRMVKLQTAIASFITELRAHSRDPMHYTYPRRLQCRLDADELERILKEPR